MELRRKRKNTPRKNPWKIFALAAALACVFAVSGSAAVLLRYYRGLPPVASVSAATPVSSKILDRNGRVLYEIHGETKRTPVPIAEMSPDLVHATLAIEDRNFYRHYGVSPLSILRAAWVNWRAKTTVQGGSTITQQLVKNTLLSNEKTFKRKVKEAFLAIKLERNSTKNDILEMYLNQVPYGRNAYGVEAASLTYFGKHAKDLSLNESAYLAALPKAPSALSPFGANPEDLTARKNLILDKMLEQGFISPEQLAEAKSQEAAFYPAKTAMAAPHFVQWVVQQLEQRYGREFLEQSGLEVHTTLDMDLQQLAETTVKEGMANNVRYQASNAALVAIDPRNGHVLAMVGSKDFFSQPEPAGCRPGVNCRFDPKTNAALSPRQPGSSFKPYTYLTAFLPQHGMTPSTMVLDQTQNFAAPGTRPYVPRNYDGRQHGLLSIRKALAGSLNVPAVRTLQRIGVGEVTKTAHTLGITTPLEGCGLSLTLGACEVKLLDHVAAFGVLANGGKKAPVTAITKVVTYDGKIVDVAGETAEQVVDPQAAYEIVDILKDNNARSFIFGTRSQLTLPDRPVAAKSGTTQEWKDGWTVGFTPSLAVGVWVGNNNGQLMAPKADGSFVAAPIWNKFIRTALKDAPAEDFPIPAGIAYRKVNPKTGQIVPEDTQGAVTEVFASYAIPGEARTFTAQPAQSTPVSLKPTPLVSL